MKRSKFSLSHYKLLTCDMGELVPVGLTEVLPGDTVQQATSALIRVSPLLAPVMHPVRVRIHHWFVPNRIIWDGWEDFITGGPDGMNDDIPPRMTFNRAEVTKGTLADYLGVPPWSAGVASTSVSALPFRAYALIWNEFYRDQDLQTELTISKDSDVDTTTNVALQKVNWEKDYLTTSRPWTQKGPDVTIPFGASAPVVGIGKPVFSGPAGNTRLAVNSSNQYVWTETAPPGAGDTLNWSTPNLQADLSSATAVNVNTLREAFAIQRYEEARARYGSRYTEYLRYLGVRSSDARLQRPEYLGGGRQTIQFSEVLQTAPDPSDPDVGVANLKGHGIGAMRSNRYRRFFEEHGWIVSLLSVLPKTMYAQALPRHWTRATKEDYFQRELQHIGQQAVANHEVFHGHSSPLGTFGYQDRYDEYRRTESTIAGDFRDTLDFWHYARIFGSDVTLNSAFVTADPTKRVNAVTSEDCLWIMANHSIQARRLVTGRASSHIF